MTPKYHGLKKIICLQELKFFDMYCLEVFHLWLRHALLIQQSCNSNICSDSLTYSRKQAVTNVLKCSFSKCSDWHELHCSEKYGGVWNFSG